MHPGLGCDLQRFLEFFLEVTHNERRDLVVRNIRFSFVKEDAPRPYKLGDLLEGYLEETLRALLRTRLANAVRVNAAVALGGL